MRVYILKKKLLLPACFNVWDLKTTFKIVVFFLKKKLYNVTSSLLDAYLNVGL